MNNRILAGTKVIVISSQETIRSEAYGTLGIEGWESNVVLPENETDLTTALSANVDSIIVAILEPNGTKFDRFMRLIRDTKILDSQIVVGCPKSSLVHRAYLRTGIESFPFVVENTPTGQNIDLSSLATALQTAWQKHCTLQLDRELTEAMESSSLSLVKICSGLESTAILKERAHIAYSLTNFINFDISFRLRVIRLSLFSDLVKHPQWRNVVEESRSLWVVKDLLENLYTLTHGNTVTMLTWPSNMPIELAIVEMAKQVQKKTANSTPQFKEQLKNYTRNLSLEVRASLNQAVDGSFNRLWNKTNERKTAISS